MPIQKKNWSEEVQNNCTEAFNLNDRYIKAYSRHSTTTKELGKLKESIEDAEFALRFEPQNPETKKQYREVKALYEKSRSARLDDDMCFACEIALIWMENQLRQNKTEDRILDYLNKILDKETVIEQIKPSNEVEKPLPPPTKLNITSFDRIPHLMLMLLLKLNTYNISLCIIYADILAIVLRCDPQKNAGRSHHKCREITFCDNQKHHFIFTLWEDFGEIEGYEIASKMATEVDLLVILEMSIEISTYQGLSLQTRYNSIVRVNPNYPQAVELINWAKENKTMLLSCASEKTSTSSSVTPITVTPAGQQVISIAEISSAPSIGVFYVEAEMAILDEFQDFCVLECSGCKQKKRTKDRKDFECPKCNRKTALVPRCSFQIDLIDGTATTTTSISAELGEKLLSMTAEDIFDITCTKMLSNKVFHIQLRKSSWASSNTTHATLFILSYMEKEHTPQSTTDRTSKKIKPLEISEVEVMATTTAAGSSNTMAKFEPPTPTKKL
ncbi:hypothetical protein H5410_009043 [Solanum commersonii]|uniref:Saposin-like type B region 1 domain-containing protein n=1 Tax=Solanum commersonii TaxID=4109 RepID=A0A9J6AHD0_SOLCO|nr:hypothetical protein H5410_009043 [Solanum commersonii]